MLQICTAPQGSAEWLAARKKGVGASESAAALGISKYKTPTDVFIEKTQDTPPLQFNWNIERGKAMERLLRAHFNRTYGQATTEVAGVHAMEECPIVMASFDAITADAVIDFKSTTNRAAWGEPGTDEAPVEYIIQIQQQMMVSGREQGYIGVEFFGREPAYYLFRKDAELQERIKEGLVAFWGCVERGTPPEPKTVEEAVRYYKPIPGATLEADDELLSKYHSLLSTRAMVKEYEGMERALVEELRMTLLKAGAEALVDATGQALLTHKPFKGREGVDSAALKAMFPDVWNKVRKQGESYYRFSVMGE